MTPKTQKGLVIKGLKQVALEQVPVPTLESTSDVIIKVHISGLCGQPTTPYPLLEDHRVDFSGSDLHNYRQAEEGTGFVLGHEMVGEIIEVGSSVRKWKVGDVVSSPFSTCCGESSIFPRRTMLLSCIYLTYHAVHLVFATVLSDSHPQKI